MNKIRAKFNEIAREQGNKLFPNMTAGLLTGQKYGLGDVLTYDLGYRHLGIAVGASLPFFMIMNSGGFEYSTSNIITYSIAGIPLEAPVGFAGYIVGISIDAFRKINKRGENKNLENAMQKPI